MLIALIPGAIIAKLLDDKVESLFRTSTWLIIAALGVMGILIYIGDKYAEKKYKGKEVEFEKISLKQAFFIGLSQALAIIPGFSRSGTTILTSRLKGLSRQAAAKFTFMLSVPTILGITIVKAKDLIAGFNIELLIGISVSAIVGILSIKFLLNYIKKKDFAVFAYYRLILVIIIAIKLIITH
jgi:undecaprenyl-diphosphatase